MKKILPIVISVILGLTSCTKNHQLGIGVRLNLLLPLASSTELASRYIIEIYEGTDITSSLILRIEDNNRSFGISSLKGNTKYTCLCWADYATDQTIGTYDATSLKSITLNSGKDMTNAFYATKLISTFADVSSYRIQLKSTLAQINFIEEQRVAANTDFMVEFDQYTQFNVFNGELIGATAKSSITFNSSATTGILGSLFVFAPVNGSVINFTSTYNKTEKLHTDIRIKADSITIIKDSWGQL